MTGYLVPAPPALSAKTTPTAKTGDATLTAAECNGQIITNTGASGTIVLTLPAPSAVAGCAFRVQLTVAQIVRLLPTSGKKIYLGGSGVATKYLNVAGVIGNYADVFCDGTDFHVTHYSGVVTKEA